MHRTTIMLPDKLKVQAQAQARERGISLSEFIRTALEHETTKSSRSSPADPLFADHAVFKGETPPDLASHHDDYLYGDPNS